MKKVVYIKRIPKRIEKIIYENEQEVSKKEELKTLGIHFFFKFVPSILIIGGMAMITIVIYPIIMYQIQYIPNTLRREMFRPVKILEDYQIQAMPEEQFQKQKVFSNLDKSY